ncbi:MAG: threonine/serine dehydratase [Chloroflexota bacterium]|nr:threonine/serine dehydratase [Chloroflexota bacterium]
MKLNIMIPNQWIEEAEKRIAPFIDETPLTYDEDLDIFLKWENHQVSGSFKVRGAFNKILTLQPWERELGLVAASAGNHGAGVALAAQTFDVPATIFVSENAVPSKIDAMRKFGAEVHTVPGAYGGSYGGSIGEAERAGKNYAASSGKIWVSPYNDGQVIAGQATLGLEILRQLPEAINKTWFIPIGGGGLMAGIASALEFYQTNSYSNKSETARHYRLFGIQSEASPFFHAIYHYGSQEGVIELPSLADGLAGQLEDNSITIPILKSCVDDIILVSEEDIADAIAYAWHKYAEKIEGSAAASIAAVLTRKISASPSIVIITGGNIQPEAHKMLCKEKGVK